MPLSTHTVPCCCLCLSSTSADHRKRKRLRKDTCVEAREVLVSLSHPRPPSSSSTGLFSVGRRKVCGGVGYRRYDGVQKGRLV